MIFSMLRHPDLAFTSEEDVIKASFEMDAVLDGTKSIEQTDEDGKKTLVSIAELKTRVRERDVEAEIARETEEPSTPPEKVLEGEEEKFDEE